MTTHVVCPGDWLGAIAREHGFPHWSALWDHPANDGLRELRGSPDLLLVGDEVHIPADEGRGVAVRSGSRVVFVARRPTDVLRLRVGGLGPFMAAFGAVPFVLEVGPELLEGSIEEEGQELVIPLDPDAKRARLTIMQADVYELDVGGLGPVAEDEGAHARLVNLGFRGSFEPGGPAEPEVDMVDAAEDPRAVAVRVFQGRHGLPRTGQLDESTRAKIEAEYGG